MAEAIAHSAILDQPVREVMEGPYPIVSPDEPLERFSDRLSRETPAVLVSDGDGPSGIVTRHDVLHFVAGIR